jgi:hypothetical protein
LTASKRTSNVYLRRRMTMADWQRRQRQKRAPKVAPYNSCIACYRGDTTTMLGLKGEAEFMIATLMRAGVPQDEATQVIDGVAHDRYGCDRGKVPTTDMELAVRLCVDCGAKVGLKLGTEDHLLVYEQPASLRGGEN